MSNLHELGTKYGTDKTTISASSDYSYLHIYEKILAPLDQYSSIKILEIGVRGGNSVNMFLERFPNAHVYGIDIVDCNFDVIAPERFSFHKVDQRNLSALTKVFAKAQSFDLIIDDGSHLIDDYINTFRLAFSYLRKSGYYIIEDVYNNYSEWNFTRETHVNGDGEKFEQWANKITKNIHLSCAFDYSHLKPDVFSIQQYPGFVVLTKDLLC